MAGLIPACPRRVMENKEKQATYSVVFYFLLKLIDTNKNTKPESTLKT
jgi:hypothetical protein